jgi:hypothetical protein
MHWFLLLNADTGGWRPGTRDDLTRQSDLILLGLLRSFRPPFRDDFAPLSRVSAGPIWTRPSGFGHGESGCLVMPIFCSPERREATIALSRRVLGNVA